MKWRLPAEYAKTLSAKKIGKLMPEKREIKDKVTFRPTDEVRAILENELKANPALTVTDICNLHLLIGARQDFRSAYRDALVSAAKRLADELRNFDDIAS